MSKIRNSLGVLVLKSVGIHCTYEEYKNQTGIDVSKLVTYDSGEDAYFTKLTKIPLIDCSSPEEGSYLVVPAQVGLMIVNQGEDDEHTAFAFYAPKTYNGNPDSFYGIAIDDIDKQVRPVQFE